MNLINILLGKGLNRAFIILTFILYGYLTINKPDVAKKGVVGAGQTFIRVVVLIFAGLMIAKAITLLIPNEFIMKHLGEQSGLLGVLKATSFGNLIGGHPIGAYSIIKSIMKSGASLPVVIGLFFAYDCIGGISKFIYGSVVFDSKILALRFGIMIVTSIIGSMVFYYIYNIFIVD